MRASISIPIVVLTSMLGPVGCGESEPKAAETEAGSASSGAGGSSSSTTEASSTTTTGGSSGDAPTEGNTTGARTTGNADSSSTGAAQGCAARPVEPGEYLGLEVSSGGLPRNYNLFVPNAYDGSTPTPVVFNFHGNGSNAAQQSFFSDFNVDAQERGVVVVYPNGVENSWNGGTCCGAAEDQQVDDVAFVRAMLDELSETMCIDADRVYATGMSNGGFMSHRLACEASDILAAVAPVAGALVLPEEACEPERPISVLHFHGTADPTVPYGGNAAIGFPPVDASLQSWADRNGCDPRPSVTFELDDVSCQSWQGCEADEEVTLCTLDGFGHCWPGQPFCPSGPSSETIRANTMILDFFEQHSG